jgi:hypothetical protein
MPAAIRPHDVATYIEQLQTEVSAPSVKQQLAAVRMMFDWLVIGQVVPTNPRRQTVRGHRERLCCRTEPCPITRIQIRVGQNRIHALGAPELRADPRFATNDLRVANRAAINQANRGMADA